MCTQKFIEEVCLRNGIQLVHYASGRYSGLLYALKTNYNKTVRKIRPRPSLASHLSSCLVKKLTRKNKTASLFVTYYCYDYLLLLERAHCYDNNNYVIRIVEKICEEFYLKKLLIGPKHLIQEIFHTFIKTYIVITIIAYVSKTFVLIFIEVNSLYAGSLVTSWTTARENNLIIKSPTILYAALFITAITIILAARCYASGQNPIVQFTTPSPSLIATDNSNSQSHSSKVLVLRVPNIRKAVQSDIRIIQANSKISLFNRKFNITSINNINRTKKSFQSRTRRKRDFNNINSNFNNKQLYLVNNQIPIEDSKSYSPKTTVASLYGISVDGVFKNNSANVSRVSDNIKNYTVYKTDEKSTTILGTKRLMPSSHDHNHNSCKFVFFTITIYPCLYVLSVT